MLDSKNDKFLMSFGKMPIANNFLSKADFKDEFFYEMKVGFNEKYSLFKLLEHPKPEQMFNSKYPFLTGSSKFMVNHFQKFSDFISKNFIKTGEKIIEIGCNDGTMLNFFDRNKFDCLSFEPSINIAKIAENKYLKIIPDFFSCNHDLSKKFINETKVIYAANVICHIPDLNNLIKNVDKFLSKDGLFIFEEPYLGSMIEKVSYDQIYDEHIYIFSVSSIKKIFDEFSFELIDTIPQTTHGGSMRYVLARKGQYDIQNSVNKIEDSEKKIKLDSFEGLLEFKKKCLLSKEQTLNSIQEYKKKGFSISGYAATSKSTTILNFCGIDKKLIDCIYDTTPDKIGKFSPGMHIPIINYNEFKNNYPDVVYLFAWNHKDEIFKKEKIYNKRGGKWFSHVNLK